jgi:LytS/YehU family sensor histidine kinase
LQALVAVASFLVLSILLTELHALFLGGSSILQPYEGGDRTVVISAVSLRHMPLIFALVPVVPVALMIVIGFNQHWWRIFVLEGREKELRELAVSAQLAALRAQVNPHFLFNSLNSINALIAARPEEARRLCVRLADFLRRSLTVGSRETIPLAEELELAEQLLAIEKVRFGDRLCHEVRADDAARACPVPPLLLQPLVENAVTHGIAQLLEGGRISIAAERRQDELLLVVENPRDPDSPGRKGAGIGLSNVKRRLMALHSDAASLRVVPQADSFRVELRLPAAR